MVAFHVAERNLIDEVEEAIEKITPVIKTAKHFHRLKHSVKDLGAITDSLIAPRVFDIASGRMIETREFGKAYRFPRYEYDITVQYPLPRHGGVQLRAILR